MEGEEEEEDGPVGNRWWLVLSDEICLLGLRGQLPVASLPHFIFQARNILTHRLLFCQVT